MGNFVFRKIGGRIVPILVGKKTITPLHMNKYNANFVKNTVESIRESRGMMKLPTNKNPVHRKIEGRMFRDAKQDGLAVNDEIKRQLKKLGMGRKK